MLNRNNKIISEELNPMGRIIFLLGNWKLDYESTKESVKYCDNGNRDEGQFKRISQ